jgi:hypothetical protein
VQLLAFLARAFSQCLGITRLFAGARTDGVEIKPGIKRLGCCAAYCCADRKHSYYRKMMEFIHNAQQFRLRQTR